MKKFVSLLLVFLLSLSFAACVERTPNPSGETIDLEIFVSSSEVSSRSDDAYVREKIQEAFYEDRGIKVNLNVQVLSESDFNTTMANKMAGNSWDAAVGYIGQAGIDEIMISQNVCMEIGELAESYENLYALVEDEMTATTTIDGSVYGIPSLEITNQYGVLIRKDYMEQVGYTTEPGHNDDLGAVTDPPAGRKKTLVNIDDFTDMMRRMKAQISGLKAPLSGYPWDVESTLTVGPFSDSGYTFKSVVYDEDGRIEEVLPGQITDEYYKTITYEYMWSKEGLWEEECYTGQKLNKLNAFVNGTTAIYVVDPEITKLINVARQAKKANPDAEFTILEPLYGVDENGNTTEKRGYMKKQSATSCLVINKKSENAEVILEYLDWLAEDEANYNLAKYGVENEHWVDAGEGRYTYPDSKKDRYETNPPYSGMYALLKWDLYSYKLYDNYTEEEYGWIDLVRNAETFSNACENMLFIGETTDMALNHQTAENDFFQDCLVKAWEGTIDPAISFRSSVEKYRTTAAEYIEWLTMQYSLYVAARS